MPEAVPGLKIYFKKIANGVFKEGHMSKNSSLTIRLMTEPDKVRVAQICWLNPTPNKQCDLILII